MNKVLRRVETGVGTLTGMLTEIEDGITQYTLEYWEYDECLCSETFDTERKLNDRMNDLMSKGILK